MEDLIKKLETCAKSLYYIPDTKRDVDNAIWVKKTNGLWEWYNPCANDAQAMELVRQHSLMIQKNNYGEWVASSIPNNLQHVHQHLNQAIVELVSSIFGERKSPVSHHINRNKIVYKTNLIIWTDYEPFEMNLSALGEDVDNGYSFCSARVSTPIMDPAQFPEHFTK